MTDSTPKSKMQSLIQGFLDFCFPSFRLAGTGYELLWREEKRRRDAQIFRITALMATLGFVIQFLSVDLPVGLTPKAFWAGYRLGVAGAFLIAAMVLRSPTSTRLAVGRWLCIVAGWIAAVLQAYGTVLAPKTPIVFSVFLCTAAAVVPPASGLFALSTFLMMAVAQFVVLSPLREASFDLSAQLVSLYVAGLAVLMITKASQIGQVQKFLDDMRELERQKQIISLQTDLVSQLRSFLPKVVFDRITLYKKSFRTSFEYATQEILRPKTRDVACLWSDIRGFTRASSTETQYVQEVAAPNIRHLTDLSEANNAIPRIIGDLLLCYYDEQEATTAIMNSLRTATEIIAATQRWNEFHGVEKSLDRVILLSWGNALVGNVGGSASSREITALGPCVNQLARLDEAVGHMFRSGDRFLRGKIVATISFVEKARSLGIAIESSTIDLVERGITVRDFPEITQVFVIDSFQFVRQGLEPVVQVERIVADLPEVRNAV